MERSSQYTSFSSEKQPANARSERKQFTENASVALQQTMLTHAHTKCPPVTLDSLKSGFNVFWRKPSLGAPATCTGQENHTFSFGEKFILF